MSLQDEMAAVRRRLNDLESTVERLERQLAQARESDLQPERARPVNDLVTIPDTPYDTALWTDSDDEGLGVRDRRAP
ncbi:hypothetical protein ACIBJC_15780 [Streptomyces sp. NPDC050509]|uniref:hypothetical protein n=1 Tax=unclassified Streptomyces TaxID=2593676 RepID=UPI002E7A2184|nr:hypothetical protein [Streptomyces sp. JV176]MEE1804316.1 hypothetical protein [Streptomyces sp. JV176]